MVGIDVDIERLRSHFENNLWADKSCLFYGRVYPNERETGIVPEIFDNSDKDYKELLLNDELDCISFFYVDPSRSLIEADVSVIFAINVRNLYDTYETRETERAMRDAKLELDRAGVAFNIENVTTGINAVSEFTFTNQNRMDMQPFYLFRFECEVNYDFNKPCDYKKRQYVLTMSSDDESQGLTLPEIGANIYQENTNVTLYPVPKVNYDWDKWVIDNVDVFEENPTIIINNSRSAKAFFKQEISYVEFQQSFETVPIESNNEWIYEDETGNDNVIKITNSQVSYWGDGCFSDINPTNFQNEKQITIQFLMYLPDLTRKIFLTTASGLPNRLRYWLNSDNGSFEVELRDDTGAKVSGFGIASSSVSVENVWSLHTIELDLDSLTGSITINDTTVSPTITGTYDNNMFTFCRIGWTSGWGDYRLGMFSIIDDNYYLIEGDANVIYSDNNTLGNLSNQNVDFWNYFADIEPYEYTKGGYTLFRDQTSGDYRKIIFDKNGQPQVSSLVGYDKILDYSGGITIGMPNLYTFTESQDVINLLKDFGFFDQNDNAIPVDFQDISDLPTGDEIEKTENENQVTSLILKKKSSNKVSDYDETTSYNELTTY